MRISIGILARNEAKNIGRTLASLAAQSLLHCPPEWGSHVEVICVPNGCTDDTADVARAACKTQFSDAANLPISWAVHELKDGGKCHAWNQFVHTFADSAADYVILLDADIQMAHDGVLQALVETLRDTNHAVAAAGLLVKDLAFKSRKSVVDRLSVFVSRLTHATMPGIAGGLYCVRGDTIRHIWLPAGLLGEDGFMRAMIVTSEFTQKEAPDRLIRAERAVAIYEPERKLGRIFKHSRRLQVGTWMNAIIYTKLFAESNAHRPAGSLIHEWNAADPQWAIRLISEDVSHGYLFRLFLWHRVRSYGRSRIRFLALPLAIMLLPWDAAVVWSSSGELRRRKFEW